MRKQVVRTAGELQHLLRGIPEDTPLCLLGTTEPLRVGYGSDPDNLKRAIVVLDVSKQLNGAMA